MKLPLFKRALPLALVLCIMAGDAEAFGKRRPGGAGLFAPPVIGIGRHHADFKRRPERSDAPGPGLMPPSAAAKLAQEVAGGKVLGVHLRGMVYHVKLRGKGRVRTVRVHGLTGRVLGR